MEESGISVGCVEAAGCVALEGALEPLAVLKLPIVLLWSALEPLAALKLPVVLFSGGP